MIGYMNQVNTYSPVIKYHYNDSRWFHTWILNQNVILLWPLWEANWLLCLPNWDCENIWCLYNQEMITPAKIVIGTLQWRVTFDLWHSNTVRRDEYKKNTKGREQDGMLTSDQAGGRM